MLFSFLFKLVDAFFRQVLILLVKMYRTFISPVVGSNCRFHPTCSQYALDAFDRRSFFRASLLVIKRISKCHPYSSGGYDPIQKSNG